MKNSFVLSDKAIFTNKKHHTRCDVLYRTRYYLANLAAKRDLLRAALFL